MECFVTIIKVIDIHSTLKFALTLCDQTLITCYPVTVGRTRIERYMEVKEKQLSNCFEVIFKFACQTEECHEASQPAVVESNYVPDEFNFLIV